MHVLYMEVGGTIVVGGTVGTPVLKTCISSQLSFFLLRSVHQYINMI